ncbi:MAG TPA: T9SS type A sorting domain-containing protein, partial [Cryomorphaceae bacterium]|nr:T9SS type A sorting domain-containing protein [Cryomorphaceae bacterium]
LSDTISGTINTVVDYETGILVGGSNAFVGTQQMDAIAYYDGNEWSYPWSFNGSISRLGWANDTLFAIGWFTEIDGQEAYRIARLVDGQWEGMLEPGSLLPNSALYDLAYYDGGIYIGGTFENAEGVKYFGLLLESGIEEVAGGLSGLNTGVRDMEVYNGELYLGGIIPMFQGNVGNHILRYNGDTFLSVGEPLGREPYVSEVWGNVQGLVKIGAFLYVMGNFYYAGDVPMYALARWDGEEWCGLYGNDFLQGDPPYNNAVWTAGNYQEKLMIYVNYLDEDDENMPIWLYEGGEDVSDCIQALSIEESVKTEVSLYPNPSSGNITLESQSALQHISVFDAMGRLVFQESVQNKGTYQLNLSHLPKGLYLLQIRGDEFEKTEKVVIH